MADSQQRSKAEQFDVRQKKLGLPKKRSVSTFLYIYKNNQQLPPITRSFINADDLSPAVYSNFEDMLETNLYNNNNYSQPHPSMTQVCEFHLKNRKHQSIIELENNDNQKHFCKPYCLIQNQFITTKYVVYSGNNIVMKIN